MGRKLYVGNLPYSATESSIRDAFSASGTVTSVSVITDRDTGQSKGFAFVEMGTDQEAQAATQAMNGASLDGRQIKVSEAGRRDRAAAVAVVAAAAMAAAAVVAAATAAVAADATKSTLETRRGGFSAAPRVFRIPRSL